MRWLSYFVKCLLCGFIAMQFYFALQISLWASLNPNSTAFQRAEHWRLCSWHWPCSIQSHWVPYEKISANLKRAVLVSEDDIFFQHKGVRVEDMQKAWMLSKQRLFEIYLNSVEWGEGVFGVGAAAQHYFVTTPAALDREQAAALASALPAPKCFDKAQYCRKANIHFPTRQEFILENMDRVALTPIPKSGSH